MFKTLGLNARITSRFVSHRGLGTTKLSRPSFPKSTNRSVPQNVPLSRYASTDSATSRAGSRIFNFFYGTTLIFGLGVLYIYVTDTRASIHRWLVVPVLRLVYQDPEAAHEAGNKSLKGLWTVGLYPRERGDPDAKGDLEVEVFGHFLRNPIGTSAGIDKHAEIPDPLLAIGPAVIEIGGTTPLPQEGNAKPRVFRLNSQNAMINRYGLNSEGADHVASQLRLRVRRFAEACGLGHDVDAETKVLDGHAGVPAGSLTPGKLLAVNIAKNKTTPENDIDAVTKDYLYCAERLAPYADILVVNVSSPNTPGLRSLQTQESLTKILTSVVRAARSVQRLNKPAVMVKVSPDEDSDEQVTGICQAIWDADVDGVIVGNTTNQRPTALPHMNQYSTIEQQHLMETGGFSGPHLYEKTLAMVKKYKKLLGDRPPSTTTEVPRRSSGSISKLVEQTKSELTPSRTEIGAEGDAVTYSVESGTPANRNVSGTPESEKQSLFKLPEVRFYDQSGSEQKELRQDPLKTKSETDKDSVSASSKVSKLDSGKASQIKNDKPQLNRRDEPKVIFATGGITNGSQALEILNAGASVAMVYTALVYGGVGTISRIKDEMRQEIAQKRKERRSKTKKQAK